MILPVPGESFEWRCFDEGWGLVCRPLASMTAHVFTGRDWSLGSLAGGDARAVQAGEGSALRDPWRAVASAVGVASTSLRRMRQVHGAAVAIGGREPSEPLPAADVMIVQDAGLAAAVQVADCVPLLVVDRCSGVVAGVHAGWRGLAARAPQVVVETLVGRCGSRPTDLLVAVGPSIGPCCYEVGPDVRHVFTEAGFSGEHVARWFYESPVASMRNPSRLATRKDPERGDRWYFDTWAAASHQLVAVGVPADQVFAADLCTASHPEAFCSYRRDGRSAGRLAAAITCARPRP